MSIRDLVSLDPAKATGTGTFNVVDAVFDSLVEVDNTTGELKPSAADSWKVSKDQKTWKFTLADRKYADGSTVKAADFERAFDRLARKATKSDAAFQLEQVAGFRAAHTTATAKTLSGVSAKGKVLTIKLSKGFAEFGFHLAHPALGPLAPKYAKSLKGFASEPLGNGPFAVEAFAKGRSAILVRSDVGTGVPAYVDRIDFSVATRVDGWAAFGRGEVDVADIPTAEAAEARSRFAAGGSTPAWAMLGFGFNLRKTKFKSLTLRRAISMAIDRAALARDVYAGTKDGATGLVPQGMRGFRQDACAWCDYAPDASRALLKKLKGKKPSIRIDHLNDAASTAVAKAVAADLIAVGLSAKAKSYTAPKLTALFAAGDQEFAEAGWIADVPSPDGFLSQHLAKGSANNDTNFRDATFDSLLAKARATAGESARLSAYAKVEDRALSRMPLVPTVFFRNQSASGPAVRAFVLDGAGQFDARAVWLAA